MTQTDPLFAAARLMPARWISGDADAREGGEWTPGLKGMGEIFASGKEASGAQVALALAAASARTRPGAEEVSDERAFLWVQDKKAIRLGGRPCLAGMPENLRHRIVHVAADSPGDALFALEEGVRCRDLAFVIGEIAGNPKVVDFTASRRLVLAAERHGVPLWLVRLDAARDLGAARMRWDVKARTSRPPFWNDCAPGEPQWRGDLFRARGVRPGTWDLRFTDKGDGHGSRIVASAAGGGCTSHPGDLVRAPGNRPLAPAVGQ